MPSVLQQARKQPHTTKIIKPLKLSSNEPQLPEMLESEPSATGLHQDANPSSRSVHRNRRRCLSADQVILLMTKSSDESDTADSDELLPSDRPNEATGSTRPQSPLSHLMDPQTESADEGSLTLSDDDFDYEPDKDKDANNSSDENAEPDHPNTTVLNQEDAQQTKDNTVRETARNHARTNQPLIRKRERDPSSWKSVVRKTLRQSGKEYTDSRGKVQKAREIKGTKDCHNYRFKCSQHISQGERKVIFDEFWSLDDNEKRHFYSKTTTCEDAKRKRTKNKSSRKKRTLKYFLPCDGNDVRVCKDFYLGTLDISQKRVNNYHDTKQAGGTPTRLVWGKSANNEVSQGEKDGIRAHIKSIPRVEAHYCRNDTNKEYISQAGLNVTALYRKYVEKCTEKGTEIGKLHVYREIFNSEFNIAFHFPKSDKCDKCEEKEMNAAPTPEQTAAYQSHTKGKEETRAERDKDRGNPNAFVVCFDLENVFALPRANVGIFFYKRKLNTLNMTGHCSLSKKAYGEMWHEGQSGRGDNDIASAVIKILHAIADDHAGDPRLRHMILWSDSCVPQNRNRVFSTAIKYFLSQHPEIETIEQKFCEPGRSSIQEVDNLHSRIEKTCGPAEIYSPVSLRRILKTVNKLQTIQMRGEDFKNFQAIAASGAYDRVPYTKVKSLQYAQNDPKSLKYKTSFLQEFQSVQIFRTTGVRGSSGLRDSSGSSSLDLFKGLKIAKAENKLTIDKKNDIKSMLKFMPELDRNYMSNVAM